MSNTGEIVASRRRQQRAVDTRQKIIKAAFSEFARNGYEGASTHAVAAAAGVRQALVTYHFKTKEELWRETLRTINRDRRDRLVARLRGLRGVDETTKLRLVLEDFVRFSAEHPEFHAVMSQVAKEPSERLDWLIDDYLRDTFTSTADLIRAAQQAGKFVPGDPVHLQYLLIGAVTRIFMLSAEAEKLMGRSPFSPEFVEEHMRVCLSLFFRNC